MGCVFTNFLKKNSKLTHDLATDKLKTYPEIVKKSLQKVSKKVCIFKSCNNKSAKIKKGKSAKKVCIFKRCNNKSAKIKKASLQKKSAYSKDATTSLQKNKSSKKQVCKKSAYSKK